MTENAFFEMLKARQGNWEVETDGSIRDGAACPLTCFFNWNSGAYVKAARLLEVPARLRDDIVGAADVPEDTDSKTVRALRRRLLRTLKLEERSTET